MTRRFRQLLSQLSYPPIVRTKVRPRGASRPYGTPRGSSSGFVDHSEMSHARSGGARSQLDGCWARAPDFGVRPHECPLEHLVHVPHDHDAPVTPEREREPPRDPSRLWHQHRLCSFRCAASVFSFTPPTGAPFPEGRLRRSSRDHAGPKVGERRGHGCHHGDAGAGPIRVRRVPGVVHMDVGLGVELCSSPRLSA